MEVLFAKLLSIPALIFSYFLAKRNAAKKVAHQFEQARQRILLEPVVNRLPVHLFKLREFLIRSGLITRPEFRDFGVRWLSSPFIGAQEVLVPGFFSRERLEVLATDLQALKV